MKLLVLAFCCCFYYSAQAQFPVDSIKTEADIETFVKQYGTQHWPDFEKTWNVDVGDRYLSEERGDPDTMFYVKWIIADFNNDGKKDLIFSNINSYSSNSHFFSLLSDSTGNYSYFNLFNRLYRFQTFDFKTEKINASTLLYLNEHNYYRKPGDSLITVPYIHHDTLIAAFGGFIENPGKTSRYVNFDTLQFWYGPNMIFLWGAAIPYAMDITITSKDGRIKYGESGRVHYQTDYESNRGIGEDLTVEHILYSENITSEINRMLSMKSFKTTCFLDSFIDHSARATIKIKTGKRVTKIIDDGLLGNYWLRLFYTKMFALSKRLRTEMAGYFLKDNF